MTRLPRELADAAFAVMTDSEVTDWLFEAGTAARGISWRPLGGIDNNTHTVEVASDPALALVEIPINGIDALLDLAARESGETARTPHLAAQRWFGVPPAGLAGMSDRARRELAANLRVTMCESGDARRPTIEVQERGTGQHPTEWDTTLLSLLASNKKTKGHQMGVYNAGGAASCRFARSKMVISRLAPTLLGGREDQVGITVIRYDPLDPDRFKSGSYRYVTDRDGRILILDCDELPTMLWGTFVKLIEYELSRYSGPAYVPQRSLWHLLHAALPAPPLPMQILETRAARFPGVRGDAERRTVSGLLHLLSRKGTADYHDLRSIDMGSAMGQVTLRYFVLNDGVAPDAYVTSAQGLTITLNGQRQATKDRAWIKRHLELSFLFRRLIVVVDGTGLTNAAKREVFSSTRETGADTATNRLVLERVVAELRQDEALYELDEAQRQRALQDATRTTTEKVKRQLASQIRAYISGALAGTKGGQKGPQRPPRPPRPPQPPDVDDSLLLAAPDHLHIISDPLRIEPGGTAALRLEINAKNDFLPTHAEGLTIVVGADVAPHVHVRSTGRLQGGRVRITLEADPACAEVASTLQVALAIPALGVLLVDHAELQIARRIEQPDTEAPRGGEPDIDVTWIGRDRWGEMVPVPWDRETVGTCEVKHEDPDHPEAITRVEWIMNEHFAPYAHVIHTKRLSEAALPTFREHYEYPVLFGLFRQCLAERAKELEADEEGRAIDIPDDYVRGEQARMARAVLMAMEPQIAMSGLVDAA